MLGQPVDADTGVVFPLQLCFLRGGLATPPLRWLWSLSFFVRGPRCDGGRTDVGQHTYGGVGGSGCDTWACCVGTALGTSAGV